MATTKARIEITAQDRTKAALSSVRGGLNNVTRTIFSVQGAIAGLVGAGGMGALIKRSLDLGDALGKTSDKLGIATEELAGLRLAAERTANMASGPFDTALQRMVRRTSEAAQGTGEAKDAIAELGLDAQRLAAMSPDEQFRAIADAMQEVGTQGDRVRLAMRLFDTEGVALVNTLSGGSEALEEYADQAERFGTAISRVDASRMEAANDAISDIGQAVGGIGLQITSALAPTLTDLSKRLTQSVSDTNGWAEATGEAVDFIVEGVKLAGQAWAGFQATLNLVGAGVSTYLAYLTAAFSKFFEYMAAVADFVGLGEAAGALDELSLKALDYHDKWLETKDARVAAMLEDIEATREWKDFHLTTYEELAESGETSAARQVEALNLISTTAKKIGKERIAELKTQISAEKAANTQKVQDATNYTNAAISLGNALFSENKALAMGSIVADTAAGIARTWAQLGWPAALPGVAAIAASGAAQLAAASGASKGGGGSISAGGGGGGALAASTPVLSEPALAGGTGVTQGSQVSITLQGDNYSADQVRELIDAINAELGEGVELTGV